MHDVSLRSSINLMDAHNLTIVMCPNLVRGSSPAKDIIICALPGGPVLHPGLPATATPPPQGRTSLGMVIKLCIQRYYEIFDEIQDRSEALLPARSFTGDDVASSGSSSLRATAAHLSNGQRRFSALSRGSSNRDSRGFDDDESIDDTMLVMPVDSAPGGPPSAWGYQGASPGPATYRARVRSEHAPSHGGAAGVGQASRARSTISIERVSGTVNGKGSIAIGRSSMRKASGAAVEAVGVTASGFFAPLGPPTPQKGGENQDG
jgi:Rho GTPase-activating protein 1